MPSVAASVLVLDADMTPALAVVRSLGRFGLQVDVAAAEPGGIAEYSRYRRHCLYHPDPLLDPAGFTDWLRERVAGGDYALVIPVTERSATAALPLLDEPAVRDSIALPDRASLECALDKDRTLAMARELGIDCPASWLIRDPHELDQLPGDLGFPLVVKPARSIGDNGRRREQLKVAYAHSRDELDAKVRHYLLFGEVLIQQYITGEGIGIELIADRGEIVLPFQHRRLHEVPLTGGGSSLRESVPLHAGMLEAARKLMQAMHWHGVAMVEFKHDPHSDRFALMEVNGRFWGSLPLSVAAGADFPVLLYRLLTEGACGDLPQVRHGVLARKLSADVYWYEMVLRRYGDPTLVRFPGKGRLLKDALLVLLPRHHFDVQQWRDWRPGWVDIKQIVAQQWARVREQLQRRRQRREQASLWREWIDSGRLSGVNQVLFLCYGNINRSAVAQRLFEHQGIHGTAVVSGGFHHEQNRPADPIMTEIAAQQAIDLSDWQSRCVDRTMVGGSDLVLVMEFAHRTRLLEDYPDAGNKILLLGMVPGNATNGEIDDPYGKTPEQYRQCYSVLRQSVDTLSGLIARRI